MKISQILEKNQIASSILLSISLSIFLVVSRAIVTGNRAYIYLLWNLLLAFAPLFCIQLFLSLRAQKTKMLRVALLVLWLIFLPNSFYTLTDFVHLRGTGDITQLYDIVLLASFAWNGFLFGYGSVYLFHIYLRKKITSDTIVNTIIGAVFLVCSFAIYLGRYLRWNSWDVITSPAGLLFDITNRLTDPLAHPFTLSVTLTFFLFIGTVYVVLWNLINAFKQR